MNSSFLSHSEHLESIAEDTASIPALSNVILDADLDLPPLPGPSEPLGGTSGCIASQEFSWNDTTNIWEDSTFASSEIEPSSNLEPLSPGVFNQIYRHNGDSTPLNDSGTSATILPVLPSPYYRPPVEIVPVMVHVDRATLQVPTN